MFTGIVEEIGTVVAAHDAGGDLRVRIEAERVLDGLAMGDSVAVSGCCLTVVAHDDRGFEVELSLETVAKTAPRWHAGARVNLERALAADGRFGGHVVTGHVGGTGEVLAIDAQPGAFVVTMRAPDPFARWLIPKGSLTVDGVSLTVVDVGGPAGSSEALDAATFTLWLIPHTLQVTTLGDLRPGDRVNLEADVLAKHVERLLALGFLAATPAAAGTGGDDAR
ncbi:MAG: riboflavin synthase [Trueperaceae bacterium]|nr:riboflavin synthase [Trueperaceae bacterium]